MTFEQARLLATIGGPALVFVYAGLISYLNDGRVIIEGQHLLIALLVGLCAFLGWPRPKTNQPQNQDPELPDHGSPDPEPPAQDRS